MRRDCADGSMRDLLPDLVHGTLAERARVSVEEHLSSCEDCAAEVRLIRSARIAYSDATVDVSKIVAALSPRPGRFQRPSAGRSARRWLLAAAASFLLVGGATVLSLKSGSPRGARGPASTTTAVSLRSGAAANGGTSDLSADQLRVLLNAIDSVSVLPSTEPEVVTHPHSYPLGEVVN